MKLTELQIKNYRSVADSTVFKVSDVTCLVGKNESGKTNILRSLERLNSLDSKIKRPYSEDLDWPRTADTAADSKSEVILATWKLEDAEVKKLEESLGAGCLNSRVLKTETTFDGEDSWNFDLNHDVIRAFLFSKFTVPQEDQAPLAGTSLDDFVSAIGEMQPPRPTLKPLADYVRSFPDSDPEEKACELLEYPKMLYFAAYDRLGGRISLDYLVNGNTHPSISRREQELLRMFLEYAGVKPEDLRNPKTAESGIAKLERAQNTITKKIFNYWSQNRELEVKFEALPGRTGDPEPFNSGTVFHTRIYNRLHRMTVPFDERSAGFTWFFSFLVQFTQLRAKHANMLILLDEPGGSLHGKAQHDLLRFLEDELKPHHQVLYTTHSPFMVPSANLERVRVVEDVVVETKQGERVSEGTKVSADFLKVGNDTRFPLQGALGYEITQSLFIGPQSLLVEGPSDILYLQAASRALVAAGRTGLEKRWTVCPAGGVSKVHAFVSLFSGNALKTAVLVDLATGQGGNRKEIENLRASKILEATRIFTAADFTGLAESDIEDMLGEAAYIDLVDEAFGLKGKLTAKELAKISEKSPRIVRRVESWFMQQTGIPEFNHYTPAEFIIMNPQFIGDHNTAFAKGLDRFEEFFKKVNALL